MLHGDVAMSSPPSIEPGDSAVPGEFSRLRVEMADGQPGAVGSSPIHWVIARMLLDLLKPKPDEMVRQWYVATSLWMEGEQQHDTNHLRHALQLFPGDVDLLFLSGCQMETYAGAAVQAAARSTVLPQGFTLSVPDETTAIGEAENFFKRTLERAGQRRQEARIRLGHVLVVRGRFQQAIEELASTDVDTQPALLRYYHALFLGAAHEGAGHLDEARAAYTRASALYPRAQSPRVALSALAMRRGDRAGALTAIQPIFSAGADDDPWWTYYVSEARDLQGAFEQFYAKYGQH
jgi:tetratricopeptide (TPR) repeat protein